MAKDEHRGRGPILLVGFRGQQELQPEIADEIGLVGTGGFKAASRHDEKDHRAVDLVATAHPDGGLSDGRMEGSLGIKLHVSFQSWREFVANYQSCKPAIRPFMGELIADFVIHIYGAKLPGDFKRQEKTLAGRCDPTPDGVVGVVEEELRKSRDGEAGFSGVVETPLDAKIGLTQAKLGRGRGVLHAQPSVFVGKLDAIADSEIEVEVGRVRNRLIAVIEGHVAEIDFPIEMTRGARVIGVVGRASLGKCQGGRKEIDEDED